MDNYFNFGEDPGINDSANITNNIESNNNSLNNNNFSSNCNSCNRDPDPCNKRCSMCVGFASILGSNILVNQNGVCVVGFIRNLNVEILGRRTRSPLAIGSRFSYENPDRNGRTLNLGEVVLLQNEVNDFVSALRRCGIIVTSINSRWLFDDPRLVYVNFESIDCPLDFARKVAQALKTIRC
ncbi:DUF1259 domain-containing protein [Clostridium sp. YIM B02551]|uniref:DUF1259 domain-containing protein n=1 Tax=Clostridium sp. YIM B02551 TaxID=2910679 RepID=UPI0027D3244D|nr:DUF1259 domain-containing protein [Clostridium sp. YIM B02551]